MSFMSDLFHGDFSNLGNDITHGWKGELEGAAALGLGALTFGAGDAVLGAAGGLGELGGLFGGGAEAGAAGLGADAAGAAAGGADAAGALSLAAPEAAGAAGSEGVGAIESAISAGGGVGGEAAPLGLTYGPAGSIVPGAETALPDAAAAGGGAGGQSGGFMNSLWEGAKSSLAKNPLGIAASAGGLGLNMLRGNPTNPNQQALQDKANQLGAQGAQLQSYLTTGTLPPAMKAQLDQATAAAKARIISNHAASGQPTDPNQNSALAQELNAVDMNAVAAMADAQIKMMQTGLSETGLSTQLYEMLVKMDRQNNTDLMNAISSFASSLGGGGGAKKGQTFTLN